MARDALLNEIRSILPPDGLLTDPAELFVYESDGFTIARARPSAVCFPRSTDQVRQIVISCGRHDVQIIPRGSGTGLAGGCVAYGEGVVVSTARMDRILEIDLANRCAHVQAGVRNTALTDAIAMVGKDSSPLPAMADADQTPPQTSPAHDPQDAHAGEPASARSIGGTGHHPCDLASMYHFSPDPSSQRASTIGGNAATNAGGIHVLKDFVTSNHVLGMEVVLSDGEVVQIGAQPGCFEGGPIDLPGLFCGSEGTLGLVTSLWVRLSPRPAAFRTLVTTFQNTSDACNAVSDIIAGGHLPAAMEMLDGRMVKVIEDAFHFGLPDSTQALLLVEIDGIDVLLDDQIEQIAAVVRRYNPIDVEKSRDADRRAELWKMRKSAFGAIGRISVSYCTQDACVPRSMLAEVLGEIDRIGVAHGLAITNVFHAGDGNIHPIFLYDERDEAQVQNVLQAAEEILKHCIDIGGTLTGEHGVGVEKLHLMPYLFDTATMEQFLRIKASLDPAERLNAGKLIPSEKIKVNLTKPGRMVPQ